MEGILNWQAALPELVLALAAMALLMLGVILRRGATEIVSLLALGTLALTAALVLGSDRPLVAFGGLFLVDDFAVFAKTAVLSAAALALVLSLEWNRRERLDRFEYAILVLFASLGMIMMVSANDLMSLYLGLELSSLSLYVLAAIQRDDLRASEAGLKYFVLGALASAMTLYGMSLTYGFAGTTRYEGIASAIEVGPMSTGLLAGLCFVAAGLAFKISAVPFHMWTPDVYEGAPTPVTAFFSVAPKFAAVAVLMRVAAGPFGPAVAQWTQILVLLAIASMLVGAFAALRQANIKRLMAYSSIGHVGYALIGFAAGGEEGLRAALLYMTIYIVMNVSVFGCIVAMHRNGVACERIDDLAGLSESAPGLAFALAVLMFSMAGIPPLAGFFAKLWVFLAAIEAGLWPLAFIGVLASVVSAFYYLRIVKLIYFDKPEGAFDALHSGVAVVVAFGAVFSIGFVLLPSPLLMVAGSAARSLLVP